MHWRHRRLSLVTLFMATLFAVAGCGDFRQLSDSSAQDSTPDNLATLPAGEGLLSAFFGLDDAVPRLAGMLVCPGAVGGDGMPVIFTRELDMASLQAGDFRVRMKSGQTGTVECVTLAPASDPGEYRTALLLGNLGSVDDPPVQVDIVGNLLSLDREVNFRGASVEVTALAEGPFLVLAESVAPAQWRLGEAATRFPFGGGSGCAAGTEHVVRATWSGGVTRPGGDEVGDTERNSYRVTLLQADGTQQVVQPFALGDLGDGDNNHLLCLNATGKPVEVSFPAGLMTDPREDLNPATRITVSEP